ncbi:squalene/phytoene synthase family protein [Sphingomonas sp.]|uniref:squalene/phytoene synthase family protein n=1 Tax=Sphingomonas sp. TaxID=28214 RepID=UPI0035C83746
MREPLPLSDPEQVFNWCGTTLASSGIDALFALDRQFGDIVRTTVQPIVGQMRLTWWFEAIEALETGPPPAQPLLADLAARVLPADVGAKLLASMSEGWEVLLDDERCDPASLKEYARLRGGRLFAAAGKLMRVDAPMLEEAGMTWALADLATHVTRPDLRGRAREMACALAEQTFAGRWRGARVLGALALDARAAMLGQGTPDGPRRAAAVARFRLFGR